MNIINPLAGQTPVVTRLNNMTLPIFRNVNQMGNGVEVYIS
jgi:hypothetical protein